MKLRDIKTLSGQVEYCLEHYPYSRNDDDALWINVCQRFYPLNSLMPITNTGKLTKVIKEMPKQSAVERIRRDIQHRGDYLPTIKKVAEKRRLNMEVWREAMSPKHRNTTVAVSTASNTPPGYDSEGNAVGWGDRSAERPRG